MRASDRRAAAHHCVRTVVWLDVRNERDFVPDYNGDIIMKVMRLSWTDEEGDIDIQVYLSVQIYPALLLIVFSLPAQPRTSQGSMQAPTTSCQATTALTTRAFVKPLQSPSLHCGLLQGVPRP